MKHDPVLVLVLRIFIPQSLFLQIDFAEVLCYSGFWKWLISCQENLETLKAPQRCDYKTIVQRRTYKLCDRYHGTVLLSPENKKLNEDFAVLTECSLFEYDSARDPNMFSGLILEEWILFYQCNKSKTSRMNNKESRFSSS